MTQSIVRYTFALIACLLALPAALSERAQATAVVRPDPASVEVAAGETWVVAFLLENATDVYGIDVRASFDPAVLEIVDADPARPGVQMMPGDFPQPDFIAINAADNAAGSLRYVVTQVNPRTPASGRGTLFSFSVRGKSSGESPLRVDLVEMANRSGELLPVSAQNGAVRVTGPTATLAPTPIVLRPPDTPPPATDAPGITATAGAGTLVPPTIAATSPTVAATPANGLTTAALPTAPPGATVGVVEAAATGSASPDSSAALAQLEVTVAPLIAKPGPTAAAGTGTEAVASEPVDQAAPSATAGAAVAVIGEQASSNPSEPRAAEPDPRGAAPWPILALASAVIVLALAAALLLRRARARQ